MITLNDYLYSGDTVLKILKKYTEDLRQSAARTGNEVDVRHCEFLSQIMELLEHNDFLTAQSQKIREFYKYMAQEYPYLSFTFKGRIKSLIRAEAKFNGYVVEYIYDYYTKNGTYPPVSELQERLNCFRDLIAYRIVISMPKCHLKNPEDGEREEIRYLYETANVLKGFLEERGFTAEPAGGVKESDSPLLSDAVRPYYRDYIAHVDPDGYRSCILRSLITARSATWRCSFGRSGWTILQRSDPPIIWGMRKSRRATGREGMPSLRGNVSTLMKPTSAAGDCTNSSLQSWMSICLRQSTTASSMTGAGCTVAG